MNNLDSKNIHTQKEKLKNGLPELRLEKPCVFGDGIIKLSSFNNIIEFKESVSWFIPASGSGSRMFQFIFDYLNDGDLNKKEIQQFLSSLKKFAFYHAMEDRIRTDFENDKISNRELIEYILLDDGISFSTLPKGLIPFHYQSKRTSNSFQDSIFQGLKLPVDDVKFHFTIQKEFENKILNAITEVTVEQLPKIEFSEQYKETDSIAFDKDFNPIELSENLLLTRPSGHGALLTNLNSVEADFILIRNIDNIQHNSKSEESLRVWSELVSLAKQIKIELTEIWNEPSIELVHKINDKYSLFHSEEIDSIIQKEQILRLINKPVRICGMVKNIGQPGGGPFWVRSNGKLTKQIIEKAQISTEIEQQKLLQQSTHFNPVMIVASVKDFEGNKYDLTQFVDDQTYFIVNKTHQGKAIQYLENPGLWNGSMAHWNSVFVEIPSEVFSPVKTILDLLDERHLSDSE
jgi:hypothetical protein